MNIIPEEECSNHEEIIAELTKRNEFLTKLVFWGKFPFLRAQFHMFT